MTLIKTFLRSLGFDVLFVDPVVSNVGISHGDDLAFIGRVSENLLVAGHARIKNDLPCLFTRESERPSLE
jgi:hypothetical protein